MMAPAAPIIVPPDFSITMSQNAQTRTQPKKPRKLLTRKNGVLFIAGFELVVSLSIMMIYIYALYLEPRWSQHLVPIPKDLCHAKCVVEGVMYTIVLLCGLEFLLAGHLLDGARNEKLGKIRFWLASMLTYLALVTIVILGMDLGGIRSPTMNSAAFINIFLRFIEILVVYAWAEQETIRRRLRLARMGFRVTSRESLEEQLRAVSTLTVCTIASTEGHPIISVPNGLPQQNPNNLTVPNTDY